MTRLYIYIYVWRKSNDSSGFRCDEMRCGYVGHVWILTLPFTIIVVTSL